MKNMCWNEQLVSTERGREGVKEGRREREMEGGRQVGRKGEGQTGEERREGEIAVRGGREDEGC